MVNIGDLYVDYYGENSASFQACASVLFSLRESAADVMSLSATFSPRQK